MKMIWFHLKKPRTRNASLALLTAACLALPPAVSLANEESIPCSAFGSPSCTEKVSSETAEANSSAEDTPAEEQPESSTPAETLPEVSEKLPAEQSSKPKAKKKPAEKKPESAGPGDEKTENPENKPAEEKTPSVVQKDIPLSADLQQYTWELCLQKKVPYTLALAIIEHESNFTPDAVNHNTNGTTDSGLMQINDIAKSHVKSRYGVTDLMDPKQNICAGVSILSDYLSRHSVSDSVMAYAIGEAGMLRAKKAGRTSTEAAREILALMEDYEERYPHFI